MNKMIQRTAPIAALAALMLGFSGTAAAADGLTQRIVTGVGQVIAAQGNAALGHIREELGQSLEQSIRPLLPDDFAKNPDSAGAEVASSADATL